MMKQAKIVIPIYQDHFSEYDLISFERCYKIHPNHPIVIVKPEGLDLSWLHNKYPNLEEESFSKSFFKSIEGYNQLMLAPEFYQRFLDVEYILIYQLDAFVFEDQLNEWCNKGYDYIGAPWLLKPKYQHFPHCILFKLKTLLCFLQGKPNRQILYSKVGNGGLSLRRTETFYRIAKEDRKTIEYYLSMKKKIHWYNEDVYWALEAKKKDSSFNLPDFKEALKFSFDLSPELCYEMNEYKLPYGCHAWTKGKMNLFWEPMIKNIISKNG